MNDENETTGGASGGAPEKRPGVRLWTVLPCLVALAVATVFLHGLGREDARDLPSALIDRPAPEFALPPLRDGQPGLSTADLEAPGVKLVNIWASWCGPCRIEHPQIAALAEEGVAIHGVNYKDAPANAERFLAELGDPYRLIGADADGRAGIEWGVYGVPETFVVDAAGRVIYKHIGPIAPEDIAADGKVRLAIKAAGE